MRGKLLGGRYRISRRIGEGGMAYVYLAKDEKLRRQVAIKILHKHMAENSDIRRRFFQEAQAISTLDHPNILKIYDFSGEHSEDLWMVMEVLQGLNLNEYVHTFPGNWLHPVVAAMITREILKALEVAHQESLIHRDVKPENIFVLNGGAIKLMDFGIVKNMRGNSITMTGTFMGSPSYMSPEQIRGKSVDHRSDIYSLGVLLYEIVTGRLPYTGNTTHDVVMKICEGKFKQPREYVPNLPEDLNKIISKAMSKHPMHRYQEARTFASDLDIFLQRFHFEESHIELERYFADKHKFEDRLRQLSFTNRGTLHKQATSQPPAPPKTTRTRYMSPDEQHQSMAQQRNLYGIEHPKPKAETPRPPTPPQVARAPRRDHQVPRKHAHPQVSRRHQFTGNQAKLNPTVLDPFVPPVPQPQQDSRVRQRQRPGNLHKQRARPRTPKRQPPQVYYRVSAHAPPQNQWIAPILGAVLVGLIGLLSVLGFINLIDRMPKAVPEQQRPPTTAQTPRPQQAPIPVPPVRQDVSPEAPAEIDQRPRTQKDTSTQRRRRAPYVVDAPKQPNNKPDAASRPVLAAPAPANERRATQPVPETVPTPVPESKPRATNETKAVSTVAHIKISSQPAAEVYIDGQRKATTVDRTLNSGWIEMTPGKHRIELRRTGYRTYSTRLTFEPGERRTLPTINLQPDTNYLLTLSSNEQPVRVLVIGLSDRSRKQFILRGSAHSQVLPAGRYKVRFEHKGKIIERNITIEGGRSQHNLNVDF